MEYEDLIEELEESPKMLRNFLQMALWLGNENAICLALILDYKRKRSKKKAIAIADIFLTEGSPLAANIAGVRMIPKNGNLKQALEVIHENLRIAESLNRFQRIKTSGSRKPPEPIFDDNPTGTPQDVHQLKVRIYDD